MRVGFVGLGNMGQPMALNVRKAGFDLVVHDRARERADPVLAAGAAWADTAGACAREADVLITSVPGPAQVREIAAGEAGIVANLRKGALWADMTTSSPDLVRELERQAKARGAQMVDAPVTGAVDGARNGRLTIFAGGEAEALERAGPVLDSMGSVILCGPIGTGNVVKLVTNQLWFVHAAAIGEGLALGKKGGVDLEVLWDAIKRSVGASFVADHDVPSIFAGHYDPSFSLDLCLKDLGLIRELSEAVKVPVPMTRAALARFDEARRVYGGEKGELHVARLIEEAGEVSLRVPGNWPPPWER